MKISKNAIKNKGTHPILILIFVASIVISSSFILPIFAQKYAIPSWVKNNAKWWASNQIGDDEFEKGIQYLFDQKIINIPTQSQMTSGAKSIPVWVKNLAGMWTTGKVSDDDFLKGIEYLVRIGLIQVHTEATITPLIIPSTTSTHTTTPASVTPPTSSIQPLQNTTNVPISTPTNLTTTVPVIPSNANTTKPSNTTLTVTSTTNPSQANSNSLVGDGVNLRINGNIASGTLTFAGIRYNAPSLLMTEKRGQIELVGDVRASNSFTLMVVGVSKDGNQYDFYGVISNNIQSMPVKFSALFTKPVANQPTTVTSNQPNITNKTPLVSMLVLYAQSDHVTMGYLYNLAVKAFDPKANPDKTFSQFYGVIPDVSINGRILDESNHIFSSFSGKTDSKGIYQYQVQAPYYQGWQQIYKVILNVTKNGYIPQSFTFSFVTIYPNQGGAAACAASIPPSPTGLTATAVSQTEIDLSWTASSGASNYNILRGTTSGGPYTQIGTTANVSFSDTGLTHGTTYYYVIQATNCAGTSVNSAEKSATP